MDSASGRCGTSSCPAAMARATAAAAPAGPPRRPSPRPAPTGAPGRRFPGSTGSIDPEDYAEIGGLWEALERKKVSFYNFGEANETAHVREEWMDTATGAAHGVMVPMQNALFSRTSHNYAGYHTNIPDQFRMDQFETEFTKMWLNGKEEMPRFIAMQVPNDHTASPRPEDGYPFQHSYVADNDLAV